MGKLLRSLLFRLRRGESGQQGVGIEYEAGQASDCTIECRTLVLAGIKYKGGTGGVHAGRGGGSGEGGREGGQWRCGREWSRSH